MAKIPYDAFTLKLALVGIPEDEALLTLLEEITTDVDNMPISNVAAMNKAAAEFHGITVVDLINSPNRVELLGEYQLDFIKKNIVNRLTEYGLDDKQAWAIVALSIELI